MSAARYRLELYANDGGTHIATLDRSTRLEYVNRVNDIGMFALDVPARLLTGPTLYSLGTDARVIVWRTPQDTRRESIDFAGLTRRVELSQHGQEVYLTLRGFHYNEILARHIVNAAAGSADAKKSGEADDVIKALVREQLGTDATDSARDLSGLGFTVEPDLTLGTSVDKEFARRVVLDVLQELSDQSRSTASTAVYFGFVPTGDGPSAVFRTRVQQWGQDVRDLFTFALGNGNMQNPLYVFDRGDEVNYVYGAGTGEQTSRIEAADQYNAVLVNDSPLNRREAFYDLRNEDDTAVIESGMQAMLRDGRPVSALTFDTQDSAATRYGIHYTVGSLVRAEFSGRVRDYHVMAVQVAVEGGNDSIRAVLEER